MGLTSRTHIFPDRMTLSMVSNFVPYKLLLNSPYSKNWSFFISNSIVSLSVKKYPFPWISPSLGAREVSGIEWRYLQLNFKASKKVLFLIRCNHSKIWTMWLYHRVMSPNDADGMANSVDPDQTAPLGAVWSGYALFAQAYLSENLGSLQ